MVLYFARAPLPIIPAQMGGQVEELLRRETGAKLFALLLTFCRSKTRDPCQVNWLATFLNCWPRKRALYGVQLGMANDRMANGRTPNVELQSAFVCPVLSIKEERKKSGTQVAKNDRTTKSAAAAR